MAGQEMGAEPVFPAFAYDPQSSFQRRICIPRDPVCARTSSWIVETN